MKNNKSTFFEKLSIKATTFIKGFSYVIEKKNGERGVYTFNGEKFLKQGEIGEISMDMVDELEMIKLLS